MENNATDLFDNFETLPEEVKNVFHSFDENKRLWKCVKFYFADK